MARWETTAPRLAPTAPMRAGSTPGCSRSQSTTTLVAAARSQGRQIEGIGGTGRLSVGWPPIVLILILGRCRTRTEDEDGHEDDRDEFSGLSCKFVQHPALEGRRLIARGCEPLESRL